MMNIFKILGIKKSTFKILGSFALIWVHFLLFIPTFGILVLLMGLVYFLYKKEKARIVGGNERFSNTNLFARYGEEIDLQALSIPTKDEWGAEQSLKLANNLIERVQTSLAESMGQQPLNGKQVITIIGATDNGRPEKPRGFLRASFTGELGAVFTYFITFQILGKNVVLQKMVYLLGIGQWYDKLFFFLSSPFTFFFWIYRWTRGDYSIVAKVCQGIENSFEELDVLAYFIASRDAIIEATQGVLREYGLLTEQLAMVINNFAGPVYNISGGNVQFGTGNSIINSIK